MNDESSEYFPSLHRLLTIHFNYEELKGLCFYMQLDYESIPGNVGKDVFARELILLCHRVGRLEELVDVCSRLREHIEWPQNPPPLPSSPFPIPAYATGTLRAIAFMIDAFILFALWVTIVFTPLLGYLPEIIRAGDTTLSNEAWFEENNFLLTYYSVAPIPFWIATFLYFALLETSRWQATFGKKLFGMRVVDEQRQRIKFKRSLLRSGIKFLCLPAIWLLASDIFFSAGVEYVPNLLKNLSPCGTTLLLTLSVLLVAFTKHKQAIHDKIAKTVVLTP
jgi:uncharacterized RDD family membrane protein YckC